MVVATFRGSFTDYDATLTVTDGEPQLIGIVRPQSVVVKDENLAGHLQSPDFFDTERYPEITFRSTSIRRGEGDEVVIDGDLTIKGTTKAVEARGTLTEPVEHFAGGERVGVHLETIVDRTAFGLNWNAPLPKGGVAVANDVTLVVELELAKAE